MSSRVMVSSKLIPARSVYHRDNWTDGDDFSVRDCGHICSNEEVISCEECHTDVCLDCSDNFVIIAGELYCPMCGENQGEEYHDNEFASDAIEGCGVTIV